MYLYIYIYLLYIYIYVTSDHESSTMDELELWIFVGPIFCPYSSQASTDREMHCLGVPDRKLGSGGYTPIHAPFISRLYPIY